MATSWSPDEGDAEQIPLVEWDQVGDTQPLAEGHRSEVRYAVLRQRGGREVPVVLKLFAAGCSEEPCMLPAEAQVLHALAGVNGVPRLHGATRRPPHILAMAWCPGVSVRELWRRGAVRACVTALLHLCPVLAEVHRRRVCHRDLRCGHNILFDVSHSSAAWLIGFGYARRQATVTQVQADVRQLQGLVTDILEDMDEAFDPDMFRRRTEAMAGLSQGPHLEGVEDVLRRLLHRHSE